MISFDAVYFDSNLEAAASNSTLIFSTSVKLRVISDNNVVAICVAWLLILLIPLIVTLCPLAIPLGTRFAEPALTVISFSPTVTTTFWPEWDFTTPVNVTYNACFASSLIKPFVLNSSVTSKGLTAVPSLISNTDALVISRAPL